MFYLGLARACMGRLPLGGTIRARADDSTIPLPSKVRVRVRVTLRADDSTIPRANREGSTHIIIIARTQPAAAIQSILPTLALIL